MHMTTKKSLMILSTDLVWYLWTGKYSSLFGKRAMTTFERYFIEDKASHKEPKNPYYYLREDVDMIRKMLKDFDLNPDEGRIINGHTPVKEIDGEDPIKADGKMLVIDGGFSKAYQNDRYCGLYITLQFIWHAISRTSTF